MGARSRNYLLTCNRERDPLHLTLRSTESALDKQIASGRKRCAQCQRPEGDKP